MPAVPVRRSQTYLLAIFPDAGPSGARQGGSRACDDRSIGSQQSAWIRARRNQEARREKQEERPPRRAAGIPPPLRPCLPAKTELNRRRDRLDFLRHRFFWYARFSIVRLHLADENETSGASLIDPRIDLYFTLEFNSRARARILFDSATTCTNMCTNASLFGYS
jgi:hypothetical protein